MSLDRRLHKIEVERLRSLYGGRMQALAAMPAEDLSRKLDTLPGGDYAALKDLLVFFDAWHGPIVELVNGRIEKHTGNVASEKGQ